MTLFQLIEAMIASALVGFSKTGMPGLGIVMVPLLADAVGARASAGVMLPMLLFADVFAVKYYRQHADWPVILRLLPWVVPGIVLGYLVLVFAPPRALEIFFGVLVLTLVVLQMVKERGALKEEALPTAWWFSGIVGVLAGFATGVGNMAGSVTGIYLISMRLDKHRFMGTSAWFYLIVNATKMPLYLAAGWTVGALSPTLLSLGLEVNVRETPLVNAPSLLFNLKMVPFIVVGIVAGLLAFKKISQKWFNRVVVILAILAAFNLLFGGAIRAALAG